MRRKSITAEQADRILEELRELVEALKPSPNDPLWTPLSTSQSEQSKDQQSL